MFEFAASGFSSKRAGNAVTENKQRSLPEHRLAVVVAKVLFLVTNRWTGAVGKLANSQQEKGRVETRP